MRINLYNWPQVLYSEADKLYVTQEDKMVHTPGPWYILETNSTLETTCVQIRSPYKNAPVLLQMGGYGTTHAKNLANAKLIAAAPDLFAALQECLGELAVNILPFMDDQSPGAEAVREIIAKADKAIAKTRSGL